MSRRSAREIDRRTYVKTTAVCSMFGIGGCSQLRGGSGTYPSESITIIVPYAEGGGTDAYARIIQEPLSEELGVDVQINNIPGETSITGLNELITSPENSHQLGMEGSPGLVGAALLFADWDPSELIGLGSVGSLAISCYGNASYDWGGFNDMVERFNNGEFNQIASIGFGSPFHLAALMARERGNWEWGNWVPYEGASPSMQAVAQDEIPFGIIASVVTRPHYQQDTEIDLIGTFPSGGDPTMPELETWTEAGFPSIDEVAEILMSVYGPPQMPEEHRNVIDEALQNIMETDAIQQARDDTGLLIDSFMTSSELNERIETLETEIPQTVDLSQYKNQ